MTATVPLQLSSLDLVTAALPVTLAVKVAGKLVHKPRAYRRIHTLILPAPLAAGDIVDVSAETQFTSDNPFAVAVCTYVAVGMGGDTATQARDRKLLVCRSMGGNIRDEKHHHLPATRARSFTATKAMAGMDALHFCGYASTTEAKRTAVDVEVHDSGHLSAIVFRP